MTDFVDREETVQQLHNSTAFAYLKKMLKNPNIFFSKISHMNQPNSEELFYTIKALQQELTKSIDFVYDFVEMNKYNGILLNEKNRFCLNETFTSILANFINFDFLKIMILDKKTGVFYDMKCTHSL